METKNDEKMIIAVLKKLEVDFPQIVFRPKYSDKLKRIVLSAKIGNKKIKIYIIGNGYGVGATDDNKLRAKPCETYWDMHIYLFRILREWELI